MGQEIWMAEDADPVDYVKQAIFVEFSTNPDCPVVGDLMNSLLGKYRTGDQGALKMAVDIARDTLKPNRSLNSQVRDFFIRHK